MDVWAEVLHFDHVGVHDDFFDLGGNSLLAARAVSRLNSRLPLDIDIEQIFRTRTPERLARAAADDMLVALENTAAGSTSSAGRGELVPVPRAGGGEVLSFAQRRLWFLDRLRPGGLEYIEPVGMRLRGSLDVASLGRAVAGLVRRHEVLRTRYEVAESEPVQVVDEVEVPPALEVVDGGGSVQDVFTTRLRGRFELAREMPFRVVLVRLSDSEHVLLFAMHHIGFDDLSFEVMARDLRELYGAAGGGHEPELPSLPVQYADFAVWQRGSVSGEVLERDLEYWSGALAGSGPLELPVDHPRPAVPSGRGASVEFTVPAAVAGRLRQIGREHDASLFMVLLAGFAALLARYGGQHDITVGTTIAGRTRPEVENLVGFFVNTLVLRTELSGDPSFAEAVDRVRRVCLDAYAHQDLPFERLVEELRPERDLSRHPLFQVLFEVKEAQEPARWPGDLVMEPFPLPAMSAKFDLELSIADHGDRLGGSLVFATDLFDRSTAERLADHYQRLLAGAALDPADRIEEVDLLAPAEHRQLAQWNDTAAPVADVGLHDLFERQARRTPDAIAVQDERCALTYAELRARSDRLANLLRREGIGPDVPVGVWLDRSVDMATALLATLKAGGAYVPLDPDLPGARAGRLLREAGAPLCLADPELARRLPADSAARAIVPRVPDEGPDVLVSAGGGSGDEVCSIYYTSGSTGTPKGVASTHRGWVNRMQWMQRTYRLRPGDGVLQKTVLSFDDSAVEIFWPLMAGGRVVFLPAGLHRDPRAILRAISEHGIAVVQFVPSMLELFLDEITPETAPGLGCLRHVISSGEALRPGLVRAFYDRLSGVGAVLHNQWGPTEVSIDSTAHRCVPADGQASTVPIGRPISNNDVHVLDRHLRRVPVGVTGDIHLGGTGLARCYWGDPRKTADAFVPHPFVAGERLYRTGDRGMWRPDGELLYLGRDDQQIKIRGIRVEPGEVEELLRGRDDLDDVLVIPWASESGDKRLAAYVVPVDGRRPTPDDLRCFLDDLLPPYMVPGSFTALAALPRTASGKIDRRRLPDPGPAWTSTGADAAPGPATETEELVERVWAEVLELDTVGVHQDFFAALGGHSLSAAHVMSRLRRAFDLELPLSLIFERPTVARLAAAIESALLADIGDLTPEEAGRLAGSGEEP